MTFMLPFKYQNLSKRFFGKRSEIITSIKMYHCLEFKRFINRAFALEPKLNTFRDVLYH